MFSLPLKERTVVTTLTSSNLAALETNEKIENVNIRKQVGMPTGEKHSSPVLALCGTCARSMEKSVTRAKSGTGFCIHLIIPLVLYS